MNKISLLFCEGAHEPPYIYRLLKVDGWRNKTDKELGYYPTEISGYLKSQLEKTDKLSDTDPWNRNKGFMPWYILEQEKEGLKDQHYILVFRLGGESKYDRAKECMKHFYAAINSEFGNQNTELLVSFFYDADEGVDQRIKRFTDNMHSDVPTFSKELEGGFEEYYLTSTSEANYKKIGLFIFHDKNGEGALEEHVIPLMRKDNEDIFDEAEGYFNKFYLRKRAEKSHDKMSGKALIGITGQLQRAGRSNSVMISDCDYITDDKVLSFIPAQKLIQFIADLFT